MVEPVVPVGKANLVDREIRATFISEIIVREAAVSAESHACVDYSDVAHLFGKAFADVVGDRRGPYRDQTEQAQISQRLSDVGWGVLTALDREDRQNNYMLQSWVAAVVSGVNQNFS